MATFESFLEDKKINSQHFQQADPDLWEKFRKEFLQMSPQSFDHSKKFYLNNLRKEFPAD